ncbi:hypothetical protein KPS64_gp50 [Shigella phage KPS64]|uniref:Uncharacterized protein n=5 Tax=Mooglevirus TaxID=1985303 RepID=A0A291AYF1_9CAUD|nr:hypothetical protein Sf15_gp67 [Shigella phage Sf15]ATE86286.1 hypothetical protein Sf18_gp12 [Shigella phage Sf18]AUV56281.1 hypothetical protein Sf19_gp64 [Shigella phage Sf19]ELT8207077.1 hypothetical protein [Escherichia coli]QBP32813.1 hypothetical protein KPS64_gp50 [Shigella phage KPS64]URY12498.1 hypothetical protein [Shigella phage ESh20]WBF69593.1 hypothetical protein SFPB_029 [Shigella phage SFPB]
MKRENAIFNDNFAIGFYGKPTPAEKLYGNAILETLKEVYTTGGMKHTEANRVRGYMAIGSAISNIKLETTSAKKVRDHFIKELSENLDGVDVKAVWLDVDGHNYTTFVFKNEDIKCLFP